MDMWLNLGPSQVEPPLTPYTTSVIGAPVLYGFAEQV